MKTPRAWLTVALAMACALSMASKVRGAAAPDFGNATISLAGQWRFTMDPSDAGLTDKWFNTNLGDHIRLPGILQAQGYGDDITADLGDNIHFDTPWVLGLGAQSWKRNPQYEKFSQPGNVSVAFLSQPPKHYLGVAWYQTDITIPEGWAGKRVELFLERARWQSTVWVDDRMYGYADSLVAPHVTDLGLLAPGKHRLTIRLDNRMMYRMRTDGHSVSDGLGATWNGIVGKIELRATSPVWIADAQIFPNLKKKSALVKVKIGNDTGQPGSGTLMAVFEGMDTVDVPASTPVTWDAAGGTAELEVPFGDRMKPWDEFHPNREAFSLQLVDKSGGYPINVQWLAVGFREISHEDKQMLLNGQPLNLRMTHFGGDFPLTGYPAMDVASWKKIIQICKDYGLNGMRFHSWCPPEAAFEAADELGFYLQPECGFWDSFYKDTPMAKRLDDETARLLAAYGNHPSFLLLSPSNESARDYLPIWARTNYQNDPRRLYAISTGNDSDDHVNGGAQYAVMPHTNNVAGGGGLLRTNNSQNAVWFGGDYSAALRNVHIPVLAHELGQWCAYPDFDVIKEYTGYLQPRNFEIFRDSAAENGVLDRDQEFAWASGKFQLACYKAEIETNMRTPGLGGFQLLDLHDNTEQGTALIGVTDPFWQPKSYVTAAEFRRFSGDIVPLTRLQTRLFTNDETLDVPTEIYNFGEKPLAGAAPYWKVTDLAGHTVTEGQWAPRDIARGKNIPLGNVALDLSKLPAPAEYKLVVGLAGTKVENDWSIWVYPASATSAPPGEVLATNSWPEAEARLAAGGKVLFTPTPDELGPDSPPLNNVPVFWNRQMNPRLESMLGLWCDAQSPALAQFPTEGFCDWQWADLVRGVRAINIESAPAALRPIVSAIDDWNRNWKLGVIFEAKVGSGRLLVSAIDLDNNRTSPLAARQLRASLLHYMNGANFNPPTALTMEQARALWVGVADAAPTAPTAAPPPEIDEGPAAARPRT